MNSKQFNYHYEIRKRNDYYYNLATNKTEKNVVIFKIRRNRKKRREQKEMVKFLKKYIK